MTTDTEYCKFHHENKNTGLCVHYIPDACGPGTCKLSREFLCVIDLQTIERRYDDEDPAV